MRKIIFVSLMVFSMVSIGPVQTFSADETYKDGTFHGESTTSDNFMDFITMLAAAAVAKSMIRCRLKTPDTILAGVGGTAYMAGEIFAWMKYKEAEEKAIEYARDEDGKLIDAHKTTLEKEKQNYEEIKKTAQMKRTLQMAAAAAFTGAAMVALYHTYKLNIEKESCSAATDSAIGACDAMCGSSDPGNSCMCTASLMAARPRNMSLWEKFVSPTQMPSTKYAQSLVTYIQEGESGLMAGSCSAASCASNVKSVCISYYEQMKKSLNKCSDSIHNPANLFSSNDNDERGRLLDDALRFFPNLFIPNAWAMDKNVGILGMGVVAFAVCRGVTVVQATKTDRMIAQPLHRGLLFTAFAALSYKAAKASMDVIKTLDGNIGKLEEILGTVKAKAGTAAIKTADGSQYSLPVEYGDVGLDRKLPTIGVPTKELENARTSDPGLAENMVSMGGGVNDMANLTATLGDGLSGKKQLSKATLNSAAKLGGEHNALSKRLRELQRKFNKRRVGAGDKPVEFDKRIAAIENGLRLSAAKSVKKAGYTSGQAAKLFGGGMSAGIVAKNDVKKSDTQHKESISGPKTVEARTKAADNDMNFNFEDAAEKPVAEYKFEEESSEKGLEKVEYKAGDISNDKSVPIWKIISIRYIRTAFPRLGEKISK